MNNRYSSEEGFTLIELLIVTAIISILTGLSVLNYEVFKGRIYEAHTSDVVRQLRETFEAGRDQVGIAKDMSDWDKWVWVDINQDGPRRGFGYDDLLVGYSHDRHMKIYIQYNGICDAGYWGDWCAVALVRARHCSGNTVKMWWLAKGGWQWSWEWADPAPC